MISPVRHFLCLLAAFSLITSATLVRAEHESRHTRKRQQSQFKFASESENGPVQEKADRPSIKNHMRLRRDKDENPIALQTSIARYVPASGKGKLIVDLIGVVHIGDQSYYQYLNRHFDQYDVLLYELVAPPEKAIPRVEDNGEVNPLRIMQKMSQSVLDLKHQLHHIDYTKDHFVHADMSPKQIAKAIDERGDNGITLFLGITADMLRQQNLKQRELEANPEKLRRFEKQLENFDPLKMLTDEYGSVKFKRMMAEQFADLSGAGAGLGSTLDTILINDRNAACMQVFQKELAKGHKRIGIFYGAAHMPDFEQRLVRDFDLERQDIQWVTAWDLSMRRKSPVEGVIGTLLEEFLRQSLKQK